MPRFPDTERLVRAYLASRLDVPVFTRVPDERPARWVQLRRIGGTAVTVRDNARLDVFAWGTGEDDTHDLATAARSALHDLIGTTLLEGVACYRLDEVLGPRRADDTLTGAARIWMTVEVSLRSLHAR